MKDKPFVFLDGDDTLWRTQEIYDEAKLQFTSLLRRSGIIDEDVVEKLDNIDLRRVPLRGFTIRRFLESMLILYAQLSSSQGLSWNEDVERDIWNIGDLLLRPPQLYDDALPALDLLQKKTHLYLLSSGDPNIQREKVERLGIKGYFDDLFIVPAKSEEVFRKILVKLNQAASSSWMVGNSLRSDVLPAKSVGMHTIHIDRGTWKYDTLRPIRKKDQGYIQVTNLVEASTVIFKFYGKV